MPVRWTVYGTLTSCLIFSVMTSGTSARCSLSFIRMSIAPVRATPGRKPRPFVTFSRGPKSLNPKKSRQSIAHTCIVSGINNTFEKAIGGVPS